MNEDFREYTSIGVILADNREEHEKIIRFIKKHRINAGRSNFPEYYDSQNLGYAILHRLETEDVDENFLILFSSNYTGTFKPSQVTEKYQRIKGYSKTLEEALIQNGFRFKLLEAFCCWDERETWYLNVDAKEELITISEDDIKPKTPAGYLSDEYMIDFYENNSGDEHKKNMESLTNTEKVAYILDNDLFYASTGYNEWMEEEIDKAIQNILKRKLLSAESNITPC